VIISHTHRFIYLHSRKTAGSSIGVTLSRFLRDGDVAMGYAGPTLRAGHRPPDWQACWRWLRPGDLRFHYPRVHAHMRMMRARYGTTGTHMTAAAVKALVGEEIWSSYTTFSFERHPFDRIISFFYWRTRPLAKPPTFAAFVQALDAEDAQFLARYNLLNHSNLPIYSINAELAVNVVGRFEYLADDLAQIAARIGLPWDGWIPREKSSIRPAGSRPADLITPELLLPLTRIFADEFRLLPYQPVVEA
jgi:hypothetical protein